MHAYDNNWRSPKYTKNKFYFSNYAVPHSDFYSSFEHFGIKINVAILFCERKIEIIAL